MIKFIFIFIFIFFIENAYSGIMPSQTRIIYHEKDKEQSLMIANTNSYPVVVQTWVDNGEGNPESANIPFISIPPIVRMDVSDVKGVRIIFNKDQLPTDRESLFWINLYEIPPEQKNANPQNSILMTMDTQIKLFFRPESINTKVEDEVKNITCNKINETHILCNNPSPLHISVVELKILTEDNKIKKVKGNNLILLPLKNKELSIETVKDNIKEITMTYVSDGGDILEQIIHTVKSSS